MKRAFPTLLLFSLLFCLSGSLSMVSCQSNSPTKKTATATNPHYSRTDTTRLNVSNAAWKKILSPEVYEIAREAGTERAFSGEYWDYEGIGIYYCRVCGNALFKSEGKFASECGWPSFFEPIRVTAVSYKEDNTHDMQRIEVNCGRCDSHLGHIFDDGPPPTYKRYCMNSRVLEFAKL